MDSITFVGQEHFFDLFKKCLNDLNAGKGSMILVSGETGFGKTFLLKSLEDDLSFRADLAAITTECQNPIGKLKVSNLQPLGPFQKIIEQLLLIKDGSANKRFAVNVGMTMLASLPLAGDVFYAVKEISKDWRKLQTEKNIEMQKKLSSAADDFYNTLSSFAEKIPIVLFMDNMQWADAQSIELMNHLAENILNIRLLVVATYKKSLAESQALPFMSLIKYTEQHQVPVKFANLNAFKADDTKKLSSIFLGPKAANPAFVSWMYEKTGGVPGIITEYLKYFKTHSPFADDGSFNTDFSKKDFLPASLQAVLAHQIEILEEDEKNILAVCSSEGMEFTAIIVSQLLNTDVLTAIKKLKTIQTKTGLIKSIGAQMRYGEKTTVYKFNQVFYHQYFEQTLEFEEYTALHGLIATMLKQMYEKASAEDIKDQIAPYLAAHSSESGDDETAEKMILAGAESAKKYGSSDVIQNLYDDLLLVSHASETQTERAESIKHIYNETASVSSYNSQHRGDEQVPNTVLFDFDTQLQSIVEMLADSQFESVIERTKDIIGNYSHTLSNAEISKCRTLAAKVYIEKKLFDKAAQELECGAALLVNEHDAQASCLLYNTYAVLESELNNYAQSQYYLNLAAEASVELEPELRLLTAANIAIIMKDNNYQGADKYYKAAKRLASDLKMFNFEIALDNAYKH